MTFVIRVLMVLVLPRQIWYGMIIYEGGGVFAAPDASLVFNSLVTIIGNRVADIEFEDAPEKS